MIVKIPADKLPGAKLNTESLKTELAAALSIEPSAVAYSILRNEDGEVLSVELELPDGSDIQSAIDATSVHNPEKSEIEEDQEKLTALDRIELLESRILALEGK